MSIALQTKPAAERDFEAIIDSLRAEDPFAASKFVRATRRCFSQLTRHPASGSPRFGHELGLSGLRHLRIGRFPWLVFYLEGPPTTVIRILHAKRDLGPLLGDEGD